MTRLVGLFGFSGFGREVLPILRQQLRRDGRADDRIVFVEREAGPAVNGVDVMAEADFLGASEARGFVLGIADSRVRQRLHAAATSAGAVAISVAADSAEVLSNVELGDGAILCSQTLLTANVRIGIGFHSNLQSYVAHDCVIGDWVAFAPKVACNGNVIIEDHAYIGTGAVIRQGSPDSPLVIGAGAVVGMGAVVTKSVPAGAVVIGNPARIKV